LAYIVTNRRVQTVVAAVVVIGLVVGLTSLGYASVLGAPDEMSSLLRSSISSKVYAADGSQIANLHGEIDRTPVKLSEIPKSLQLAVVAIEDRRFYTHGGVDIRGTVRAAVNTLRGVRQGGSTITQQLVKNLHFRGRDRTLMTKAAEAVVAVGLDRAWSKEGVLEAYLNSAYFGRGAYGVQAASRSFFRKDVGDLDLSQSAFLAGLIHMPAHYDFAATDAPDVKAGARKAALNRRNVVVDVMRDLGFVTGEQAERAKADRLVISPPPERNWKHPYYVDAVLRDLGVLKNRGTAYPDERFDFLGATHKERAETVYRGGLRIHTALVPDVQEAAERAMSEQLPPGVLPKASAALASVEPGTGGVAALVGGRDYYPEGCEDPDSTNPVCRHAKVNLALGSVAGGSDRQPGSSFKPIVLAAGLEDGLSLRQTVDASPFTYRYDRNDKWKVQNYEGSAGGTMDVVDATVRSVNAAYARLEIQFLGDGNGIDGAGKVAAVARKLGIGFPTAGELEKRCGKEYNRSPRCTPADRVPAIALGAKETSPLQMAGAYATFANDGVYAKPTFVTKITHADGKVLYEAKPERRRAVSSATARGVSHVLEQAVERGTGRAAIIPDRPVAGKTGTAQMWRDAWFAGYVPQLTTVTWIGNPTLVLADGKRTVESMTPSNGYPVRVTGGSYPARLWHAAMAPALEGRPVETFAEPPRTLFGPPKELKRFEGEEEEEADVSDLAAIMRLERSGKRVVVHRECPPGGGTRGINNWKQEQRGDETHVWRSRAVCP